MTHYIRTLVTDHMRYALRINLATQERRLSSEPVCDFCGHHNPVWAYAAKRLSNGQEGQAWRWLACADCADALEAGNWARIVNKVTTCLTSQIPGLSITQIVLAVTRCIAVFNNDSLKYE